MPRYLPRLRRRRQLGMLLSFERHKLGGRFGNASMQHDARLDVRFGLLGVVWGKLPGEVSLQRVRPVNPT